MRDGDGAGEEFDTIRQIDIKPGVDKELPTFSITLANGKSGQFTAALLGSFRGGLGFWHTEIPIATVTQVIFK